MAGFLAGLHLCPRPPALPRRHGHPRHGPPRPSPAGRRGAAPWELSTPPLARRQTAHRSWGWARTPRLMNCTRQQGCGGRKGLLRGVEYARPFNTFYALSLISSPVSQQKLPNPLKRERNPPAPGQFQPPSVRSEAGARRQAHRQAGRRGSGSHARERKTVTADERRAGGGVFFS